MHLVGDRRLQTSVNFTRVTSPMFLTRCIRYFVQLPQMEMRLRSELRQESYRFLNRLMNYDSPPFLHKPIVHTLGPTQPIQHTIVPPRAYCSTSVVLHEGTCGIGLCWIGGCAESPRAVSKRVQNRRVLDRLLVSYITASCRTTLVE